MSAAATVELRPGPAWTRLLVACALSLALHCVLLLSVSVQPGGPLPVASPTIHARLEPAGIETIETPAEAPVYAAEQLALVAPQEPVNSPPQDQRPAPPEPTPAPALTEPKPAPPPVVPPPSAIELPMSRDPAYYALKELDVPPNPLSEFPKYYPQAAAAERLSGRVRILVLIDEFGVVNETSVIEAHPTGYFEDVTRAAVTPTRFSPGIRNGRPVKSRVVLTFGYAYGETDATIR